MTIESVTETATGSAKLGYAAAKADVAKIGENLQNKFTEVN